MANDRPSSTPVRLICSCTSASLFCSGSITASTRRAPLPPMPSCRIISATSSALPASEISGVVQNSRCRRFGPASQKRFTGPTRMPKPTMKPKISARPQRRHRDRIAQVPRAAAVFHKLCRHGVALDVGCKPDGLVHRENFSIPFLHQDASRADPPHAVRARRRHLEPVKPGIAQIFGKQDDASAERDPFEHGGLRAAAHRAPFAVGHPELRQAAVAAPVFRRPGHVDLRGVQSDGAPTDVVGPGGSLVKLVDQHAPALDCELRTHREKRRRGRMRTARERVRLLELPRRIRVIRGRRR